MRYGPARTERVPVTGPTVKSPVVSPWDGCTFAAHVYLDYATARKPGPHPKTKRIRTPNDARRRRPHTSTRLYRRTQGHRRGLVQYRAPPTGRGNLQPRVHTNTWGAIRHPLRSRHLLLGSPFAFRSKGPPGGGGRELYPHRPSLVRVLSHADAHRIHSLEGAQQALPRYLLVGSGGGGGGSGSRR
jgi:hypothetical protein